MSEPFFLIAGDLLPIIDGSLQDATGAPLPLSAASLVELRVRPSGVATSLFTLPCAFSVATAPQPSCGHVTGFWSASQVPTLANFYEAQFRITYASGKTQRVPNPGFQPVTVGTAIA